MIPPSMKPRHADVYKPEWEKRERVHDWRNHVPEEIRAAWSMLNDETKQVIAFMAELLADREEWE